MCIESSKKIVILLALFLWSSLNVVYSQSPHGADFKIDCASCHNTNNWEVDPNEILFDHNTTLFSLEGQHNELGCISCHSDLVFSNANTTCISCHQDIHSNTLGSDCIRCHDASNWLVDNIPQIHQENGFELIGQHGSANCIDCHFQVDELVFPRIGNECIACHLEDYASTMMPNHGLSKLGTNCVDCHSMEEQNWSASFFSHEFFPLEEGHQLESCVSCHTTSDYSSTPSDCISCHEADYNRAENPSHTEFNISTDCLECHTLSPDWQPAVFTVHDDYFPIYSGGHAGVWDACVDCHTTAGSFQTFECINCHVQGETAEQHENVVGYFYSDTYCKTCHPTGEADQLFDHNSTAFPLEGAHRQTDCRACHEVSFTGTSTVCVDCHQMDYTSSIDPNHISLNLSMDCATCHTAAPNWQPALFPVHDEFYELRGAHQAIENECFQCHSDGYQHTPNTCVGCHEELYQTTINPNHTSTQFSLDCASCHNEDKWYEAIYGHEFYPLTGAHEQVSEGCISCHTNEVYQATPNTCVDCHQLDYEGAKSPDHLQFDIPTDCASCHSTEPGWQPATFDIHDQYYVLEGAHRVIQNECASCHNASFTDTPTDCIGCHNDDYQSAIAPNHVALQFPTTCVDCHGEDQWIPSTFNHDEIYVLEGGHRIIENECLLCHADGYINTPNTCVGCHEGEYQTAINPIHSSAGFGTECLECHGQNKWDETTYGHEFYPLTGAHEQVSEGCISCHTNEVYQATPNTCVDCHQLDYEGANSPDHVQFAIPTDCASCHSTEPGWQPATFDIHDQYYVLEGAHRAIQNECASCHNTSFTDTPTDCIGCHQQDYTATKEPNHELFEFSTNCLECHTQDKWEPSTFDHDEFYELRGAHAAINNECNSCHINGYQNTPNTCVGCHSQDFDNARNPNHTQAGFSSNCASCHSENAWEPSTFNHNQYYSLTGGHDIIKNDCNACHANGYSNTPTDCYSCHQSDYVRTRNPDHEVLGFPTDCASCHTTSPGWSPATFDHDQFYALRGAHASIANECSQCHNSTYTNTSTTCFGCHSGDYNNTRSPNHSQLNFSANCANCHSENAWEPATFDHDQFYALRGAHASIANECSQCHNNTFTNTPTTCFGCHSGDYNSAINPNHSQLNFSANCANCHSENAWEPATFDHDQFYTLRGAHASIANECSQCHNSTYTNTPTTCFGCHSGDYNSAINPNHSQLNFSTNCATCHSENTWIPASFDHDQFYALRGAHASIANECSQCHNSTYTNTPTTCFGCHSSDYNNASPNHVQSGFSTDCASCHGESNWEGATFDHDNQFFPIYSGEHRGEWNSCTDCHTTPGNYNLFSCIDCHEHNNSSELARDHRDISGYVFESNACYSCHPRGDD